MNTRAFFKTLACLSGISFIQPLALFSEPKTEQNAKVYRFKFDSYEYKFKKMIFTDKECELAFGYCWARPAEFVLVSEIHFLKNGGCCFGGPFNIYPHGEISSMGIVRNEVIWTLK